MGVDHTSFTYDAIGNRLTEVAGSTTTYTYPSTNSKLSSVGANSYTYDAMGNVTADGTRTYVWSAAGLLKEAKIGGSTVGAYTYDASNQRTKKVAGGNTIHYVYGLGGLVYGEYDNSGNLIREYVWLNGEPLAQIDAGTPEVLTYLHTDHLMTPRYSTNAGGSTVWTWDSGAFGKEAPTGSATVNLRFPGQYYDSESTLHYNWNRYYNSATGRYISSDPIGLAGGLNTFGYADQNPLMFSDPEGQNSTAIPKGAAGPLGMCLMIWDLMQGSICGGKSQAECMCIDTGDPFWCDKAAQEKMSRGSSWPPAPSPVDGTPERCTGGACGPAGGTTSESKGGKQRIRDTRIEQEWINARAAAIAGGGKEPDRCEWLKSLKKEFTAKYGAEAYRKTAKEWDCKEHGMQVKRSNK